MTTANRGLQIKGIVQGVGFRPTVYLYAQKHRLTGWVLNSAHGVEIEIHGDDADLDAFIQELRENPPRLAKVDEFIVREMPFMAFERFEILESENNPEDFLPVSPDLATCPDCRDELFNPADRRFRYPFINCTNCGPRFSILKTIPYDRPNTSMAAFALCENCASEYHDPADRRFHAQPVACPVCGPHVWFEADGETLAEREDALQMARQWLAEGKILAVKGLGGFHLVCSAQNREAVEELRRRKRRSGKPFALMAPDLAMIKQYAEVGLVEAELLSSSEAPIVLMDLTPQGKELAASVAPGQSRLGFMLPYTPLHHLLLSPAPGFPDVLVMTSANLSEEPIAYDNEDARERLSSLADGFLMHNRPIYMRVDDSVVAVLRGERFFYRRARGYAPSPLRLPVPAPQILAAGTQLKNTFCLARGEYAFVSHFIGDLENQETLDAYEKAIQHYEGLFRIHPQIIACDLHPDYLATRFAARRSQEEELPLFRVQHHHAHITSCMAENGWDSMEPVIGLAYDGTGFGTDGTIWGGEIMVADYAQFERSFHLHPVPLPGGDLAVRKPARMAVSYLLDAGIELADQHLPPLDYLAADELAAVRQQVKTGFNALATSSIGRLFDAVSSIIGLTQEITYEAQAAITLEAICDPLETGAYPLSLLDGQIETADLIRAVVRDTMRKVSPAVISARFHNSLVNMSVEACRLLSAASGIKHVAISGGVWQNQVLMKKILPALEAAQFVPLYHHHLPPNDACVSLGQTLTAMANYRRQ